MQKIEREILAVTDSLTRCMINRDLEAMDKILDKSFTLTHITGYVQSRSDWLKEIEAETMKYYNYVPQSRDVNIAGKKAEVIEQNVLDARIWGTWNKWGLQQTIQLEKRNNTWIILNSVATLF
ncbi:nuclear transport factor 2 family protein [Maribacter stanieri]|uniref:nuclear transport factor 2 family protein n=1 Tax=Maribacter stanieri TaxID=440514 RepID=UPI0030DC7895